MGEHHEIPNDKGYLLTQGILTASLSIRLASEYNILMYSMEMKLLRKVWAGEKMKCVNIVEDIFEKKDRRHIVIGAEIYNEEGNLVYKSSIGGIILED